MRKLIAVGIPVEEIVTVDGSQGKEAESVIVCLTRGSSSKHLLLLKRANVALTRSKRNLAVSAPPPILAGVHSDRPKPAGLNQCDLASS